MYQRLTGDEGSCWDRAAHVPWEGPQGPAWLGGGSSLLCQRLTGSWGLTGEVVVVRTGVWGALRGATLPRERYNYALGIL